MNEQLPSMIESKTLNFLEKNILLSTALLNAQRIGFLCMICLSKNRCLFWKNSRYVINIVLILAYPFSFILY